MELLLASMLTAVLMAGLWSLLSTYERLFTSGETRTERAQLVRSVLDQFADDLTSAIADNAASPSGGTAAVRRFGLFGTSQAFQVDVLQVPPTASIAGSLDDDGDRPGRGRLRKVPELHTVQWRFETADGEGRRGGPSWSGLIRRELDWETPGAKGGGVLASRRSARSSAQSRLPRQGPAGESPQAGRVEMDPDDESILRVPEVVGVEFRYFDGRGWNDEWNSLTRKSLPMAVEIVLRVKREEPAGVSSEPPPEEDSTRAADRLAQATERSEEVSGESHRLLVYIPSTSLARRVESEKPSVAGPPPLAVYRPRPLPSPPPMPAVPRRPAQTVLPDQWMRTGQ
jgi:type II secretory pathway component PulJ